VSPEDSGVQTTEGDAVVVTADGDETSPTGAPLRSASSRVRRGAQHKLIEWGAIALVALLLALGIRTFVFQAFFVPSGSMIPTLQLGDRILVQKLFFSASDLHTGDIVVFHGPAADANCGSYEPILVKRVIGLPGETIQSKGNTVYLNGQALKEPWLPAGTVLGKSIPKETVPAGQYYMMGDNRDISCDSRYWGTVPGSTIIGKVFMLWWRGGHPAFHIY
jgi:signal peptidase I